MDALQHQTRKLFEFQKRLFNSRFFMFSLLIHILFVVIFGGKVIFDRYAEPEDFTGDAGSSFVADNNAPEPPQQQQVQQPTFSVTAPSTPSMPSSISAITTSAPSQASFSVPTMVTPTLAPTITNNISQAAAPAPPVNNTGMSKEVAQGIAGFTSGWAQGGGGAGSSVRERKFKFTAYLAKYSGGDWDSTVVVSGGKIVHGSLPNLLYVIGKLSRDKVEAAPDPVPLDLSSQDIFAKKPPFIIFTGHRDFVLTDTEVQNLQKYVRLGGCIWGDSSLPGLHSAFDIAFRREMRRVMPDKNIDWEEIPANNPIFNNGYYQEIKEVVPGMNYYQEPFYCLKYYGQVAILYTPNDYGDMWQFGLDENLHFDTRRDEHYNFVAMNRGMWDRRNLYYRNIEEKSVADCYKMGMNIIIHLLTRWEDATRNVAAPSSL